MKDLLEENISEIEADTAPEEATAPENADEPKRDIVPEEALEAVLFAAGHAVSYATLARTFNMTPGEVKNMVNKYAEEYNNAPIPRGVILLAFKDACQLCTKEYYLTEIREALGIRKSGNLSNSSLETLAIIAYNQPVTRIFVDTLRRSDSSYAMSNLLDRGLIECIGRMDVPGRPMLYATSNDFLRCFGLSDLSELPRTTDEIVQLFEKGRKAEVNEAQLVLPIEESVADDSENDKNEEESCEDNAVFSD